MLRVVVDHEDQVHLQSISDAGVFELEPIEGMVPGLYDDAGNFLSREDPLAKRAADDADDEDRDDRGRWTSGGGSSDVKKLTPTGQRAYSGRPVELNNQMSKLETGALGEKIATAYLRDQMGIKDAHAINADHPNYPVDLQGDHQAIEVKTGLVSNGAGAQKWRATIGQPGKAEAAWLKTASAEDKAAWNAEKAQAIMDRKTAVVKQLSKEIGDKVSPKTVTVLVNPDTRTADVHVFDGFHAYIGWNSQESKDAYVGSFKY